MTSRRPSRWQLLLGALMLPVSMLPFAAYGSLSPEGRLLRDRVVVRLAPPQLPELDVQDRDAIAAMAPHYDGAVMALVYHGVGDVGGGAGGDEREGGDFTIEPGRFAEHLVAIAAAGLVAVTASDVADAHAGRKPLPPNAVMISFDDGRSDAMLWADPLLADAGVPATMFVIAASADARGAYYANWDELRGYAASKRWDLQAHTDDLHRMQMTAEGEFPALTSRADEETIEEFRTRVAEDLERSSDRIADQTGSRPVAFAYPFGAYGADRTNDPRIEAILDEEVGARFEIAFHQDDQDEMVLAGCGDEDLRLRRLDVQRWTGLELIREVAEAARRFDVTRRCP